MFGNRLAHPPESALLSKWQFQSWNVLVGTEGRLIYLDRIHLDLIGGFVWMVVPLGLLFLLGVYPDVLLEPPEEALLAEWLAGAVATVGITPDFVQKSRLPILVEGEFGPNRQNS